MLAFWVGGISIFTFLIMPLIFKSFGRDMASAIADKLFPFYFPYNLIISVLVFVFFLASGLSRGTGYKVSFCLIIIAMAINIFITFKLYPAIKEVKQGIVSFERTSPDSPGRKQFGKLHGFSAVLNLLLLADGTALVIVSSFLKK
jgi:hypothetical protein